MKYKPQIIITSEMLISWKSLERKLKSLIFLSPSEAEYLFDKTKLLFKGLASEELLVYNYRIFLKRNFYEEIYLNLDTSLLKWIEKNKEKFNFILITHLKNFRAIFREHLQLFDKIFVPQEYNKYLTDKLFLKIIFSYAYNKVKNPTKISIITSFKIIRKIFKDIDPNVHVYYIDIFKEDKKEIKERNIKEIERKVE